MIMSHLLCHLSYRDLDIPERVLLSVVLVLIIHKHFKIILQTFHKINYLRLNLICDFKLFFLVNWNAVHLLSHGVPRTWRFLKFGALALSSVCVCVCVCVCVRVCV